MGDAGHTPDVGKKKPWLDAVIVGVIAFALFTPTLGFGLLNYDDPWLVRDNRVLQELSWSSLSMVFFDLSEEGRQQLGGEYLPLRDLSVMADFAIWGDSWGGHHFTNVAIYAALCVALLFVLQSWLGSRRIAFWAALLFAVHPIHVEAVAWVSERKGLLSALFFFLAALVFRRFLNRRSWGALAGTGALLLASIWSKGVGVAGIGFLAALMLLFPPRAETDKKPIDAKKGWIGLALLFLISGAAFLPLWFAGQQVQMVSSGYHGGSFLSTLWLMARVHATYLLQLFFVGGYSIRYPIEAGQPDLLRGIFGAVAALGFVALSLWGFIKAQNAHSRTLALAAATWLIFLAPVSQVIFPLQNFIADRYLFLPLLGWAIAMATVLDQLSSQGLRRLVLGALVLVAAAFSLMQLPSWSSSRALYLDALELNPRDVDLLVQLARIDEEAGQSTSADRWLERATSIAPDDHRVLMRRAFVQLRRGDRAGAVETLRRAVSLTDDDRVRSNLALLLLRDGQLEEALELARAAVARRPFHAHNQRVLGLVALEARHLEEAERAFTEALRYEPNNPQNWQNMAALRAAQGREGEAREILERFSAH